MIKKKSQLEAESVAWVQGEYRKLFDKRLDGMAAFLTQELRSKVTQQQKPAKVDTHSIENLIDRAWDNFAVPIPKEAVAFEIWNCLHRLGVEITHTDRCRYLPKMEGGVGRLREAFRAWYEA